MADDMLKIERRGAVAVVTLNRPERLNALSLDLMEELVAAAEGFRGDLETRAVVVTGAGRCFSAGADLKDERRAALREADLLARSRGAQLGQRLAAAWHAVPQITVAAINGAALGGGAVLVSALDFRVGGKSCRVGYPEINLGMNLSWYGLPLCLRLVGPARAKRMVILGEQHDAGTLLDWGFLDDVVEDGDVLSHAVALAEQYAAQPAAAAQMIKRSVNVLAGALDPAIMHMDTDQLLLTMTGEEHREAVARFLTTKNTKDTK